MLKTKHIWLRFKSFVISARSRKTGTVPGKSKAQKLQTLPASNGPQVNAPLENLPPEIRRVLLSTLELDELSALVHASPVFHQQYLLDRRFILCSSLQTTLREVTVDAYAVHLSSSSDFSKKRMRAIVDGFLARYRDLRSPAHHPALTEKLSEDEAVRMAVFFNSVLNPLVRHYVDFAWANLAKESEFIPQSHAEPVSRAERVRLVRAFYRLELWFNLCGKLDDLPYASDLQIDRHYLPELSERFVCLFEPWEVEELACIYAFAQDKYNQVFDAISSEVHPDNPRFDGQMRPPTPDGAFELDNSWNREFLLEGTMARGIELLHALIFKMKDLEHLVSTMQEKISRLGGAPALGESWKEYEQTARRDRGLSSRDEKQQRREPLPFTGDKPSDAHPPLAWTLIWKGTYSNLYGEYIPGELRSWGYVMWDAPRMERTGACEVLARQWETRWDYDDDPRDWM
ncbi:hypothetical protein F5Y17DRAFT_437671 [Xylariaceae sp. FL0594]|nr:hypothetical protein F5Y17DRAFT_437671 [Xylariaceae sp. FL0594]